MELDDKRKGRKGKRGERRERKGRKDNARSGASWLLSNPSTWEAEAATLLYVVLGQTGLQC